MSQPNKPDEPMDRFDSPEPDKHFVYQPPHVDMEDWEVEAHDIIYPDKPPGTFVISGPLGDANYPGRRFTSLPLAEEWVEMFYGEHFGAVPEVGQSGPEPDRWAFIVRPVLSDG